MKRNVTTRIGSLDFFYGFNNFAAGNSRRMLNDLVPDFLKYIDLKYLKIYIKPLVAIIYLLPFIILMTTYMKKISFWETDVGLKDFIYQKKMISNKLVKTYIKHLEKLKK